MRKFKFLCYGITKSYSSIPEKISKDHPSIVVLVGPSGSGKTKIASRLLDKINTFVKLKSYTTKDSTSLKENDWYNYISLDDTMLLLTFSNHLWNMPILNRELTKLYNEYGKWQ